MSLMIIEMLKYTPGNTLYLWYKHYDKCQSCAEHCDDGGKHEESWRIIFNNDADSGSNCA